MKLQGRVILAVSVAIRVICLLWSVYQDANMVVAYTDIDYTVISDGAHHVLQGRSPYERATYRYSPVLALLMTGNHVVLASFGKLLFCCCDIVVTWLLLQLLSGNDTNTRNWQVALYWAWNPLVINVSTRGNADTLIVAPLVLCLYLLSRSKRSFLSGVLYGFACHLKPYPVYYAPAFLPYLWRRRRMLLPFIAGGALGSVVPTYLTYHFYGFHGIYEAYLYHLTRLDHRHNLSVFHLLIYLSPESPFGVPLLIPQLILMLLAVVFFARRGTFVGLARALLFLTFALVVFNKVATVQYFIWWLPLIPISSYSPNIRLVFPWVCSFFFWLYTAYKLEFLGQQVFLQLWVAGCAFFVSGVTILYDMIEQWRNLRLLSS